MNENTKQNVFFLAIMTLGCFHVFVIMEEWNPLNNLFTLVERLFSSSKRKHVLKHTESHRCEVDTLGMFACNFSMFFKVLKGIHFRKLLTESERSDRF